MKYFNIIFIILSITVFGCSSKKEAQESTQQPTDSQAKITFIELGSVNCVPCKMMQPVMEAVEKNYGDQLDVVFYDVWKPDQKKYASQYKIRLIPTQVFLDKNGNEFFRHEGFFAETQIDSLLQSNGLTKRETPSDG